MKIQNSLIALIIAGSFIVMSPILLRGYVFVSFANAFANGFDGNFSFAYQPYDYIALVIGSILLVLSVWLTMDQHKSNKMTDQKR